MNIERIKQLANKYPLVYAALYPAMLLRAPFSNWRWKLQQHVLTNLSELLVENPTIKVDEFKGVFTIDPRSDLFTRVILKKEYEPRLSKLCVDLLNKDRDVIDVGANVGFYSVLFAKSLEKGRVIAVEPTQNALKSLKKNIAMNSVLPKVEIFEGVASDFIGTLEIKTIKGKEEYSSINGIQHKLYMNEVQITEKVQSLTIDELVKQKKIDPGFIKIDVEGAEDQVFKGAEETLKSKRPLILSEITDTFLKTKGSSAKHVTDFIKKFDYKVYDVGNTTAGQVRRNEFEHILCVPSEHQMHSELTGLNLI